MSSSDLAVEIGDIHSARAKSAATEIAIPSDRRRFYFVDALRGFAAVLVLIFHLWHNAGWAETARVWPRWVDHALMSFGSGVDIFFVISGFVITYSIRNLVITPKTAGNFALRRQVRLDPPYWLCTFLFWGLTALAARRTPDIAVPSLTTVALNLVYLQGFFGRASVNPVAWTLCLEVQFYLVFIGLAWLAQTINRPWIGRISLISVTAFIGVAYNWLIAKPTPWFISSWPLFSLGAIAYWTLAKQVHGLLLATLCVAVSAVHMRQIGWSFTPLVGPLTAIVIVSVERADCDSRFNQLVFRYFAAISYSLYLIHFHLVSIFFRQGTRHTGHSALSGTFWSVIAGGIVIGLAHVIWLVVERPAKHWASSLKKNVRVYSA